MFNYNLEEEKLKKSRKILAFIGKIGYNIKGNLEFVQKSGSKSHS